MLEKLDTPRFYWAALGGGLLILLISGWVFWHGHWTNPEQVFWSTIDNNLVTAGVTKDVASSQDNSQLKQTEQITLGTDNVVHLLSNVESGKGTDQYTVIKTETIATPTTNYNRYVSIQTSSKKPPDFKTVLGKWSKTTVSADTQGAFAQAIYDIIPFANINSGQRHSVITNMQQNHVYTIDFNKVARKTINGQPVFEYNVEVAPAALVAALKQIDGYMKINQLSKVDPNQYVGQDVTRIIVDIGQSTHQMVRLTSSPQVENYSAYGVTKPVAMPKTTLSQAELQKNLSNILSTR